MNKSIRSVVFFIVLIIPILTYGQVGIGTETPTQEFEIKGSIKLLDLESNSPKLNRQLKSDDQGDLQAEEYDSQRFYFKRLSKESMTPIVINVNQVPKDLNIKLIVEVEPRSEAMIILMYNIPIYFDGLTNGIKSTLPYFGGIQLISSRSGNLVGGNRRFTFPVSYDIPARSAKGGIFLEGKYVDVIRNTSNRQETVTYSLKGYTTGLNTAKDANFSDIAQEGSFGVGVFSCQVFNKFL